MPRKFCLPSPSGVTGFRRGIYVAMITGDNARTADAIAAQVGSECLLAEVLPEDKVTAIRQSKTIAGWSPGSAIASTMSSAGAGRPGHRHRHGHRRGH